MNNRELGEWGEDKAIEYLKKQSYKIIKRNFRYSRGEIDIIAEKNEYLIFVEVKLRKSKKYGSPELAVDIRKQTKIRTVANYYLMKNSNNKKIRFDVICIEVSNGKGNLKHYKNAF
ncbi:YraN family protein [Natronospora cellulosivora (SeqCode)]